jgi:L-ascorbate metabolism protein UlaG (beta-lactamase superfamily)
MPLTITWLGHSAFLIVTPDGRRIVTDPWLSNPKCPSQLARPDALKPVDLILLSHGHDDHVGEVVSLTRATGAPVVCGFEVGVYLSARGLRHVLDMGIGGTQEIAGIRVTMTQAAHSSGIADGNQIVSLGTASGFVLRAPQVPTIYFAGDTGLFGDMKIIGEIYRPAIAFLPIGDHFTMGPDTAAIAARWLGVRHVVPMHWGTFPLLTGTPAELRRHLQGAGIDVLELTPGQATTLGLTLP